MSRTFYVTTPIYYANAERLTDRRHHDRNRRGRGFRRLCGGRAAGHDEVDAAADQVGHERGKAITVPIGRAIFDLQVLPFYIAVLVKAAQQRAEIRLVTIWR